MRPRLLIATALLAGGFAAPAFAQPGPVLTYEQALSRPAVMTVQHQLQRAGDYNGAVDGNWGPDSVAALQRFQQTHGLQVTGQLNEATVDALGLSPQMVVGRARATSAQPMHAAYLSPAAVRAVQHRLAYFGFYNGNIDGVWGPRTQQAMMRFQQSRGLQPTSQLNPATVNALRLPPQVLAER